MEFYGPARLIAIKTAPRPNPAGRLPSWRSLKPFGAKICIANGPEKQDLPQNKAAISA